MDIGHLICTWTCHVNERIWQHIQSVKPITGFKKGEIYVQIDYEQNFSWGNNIFMLVCTSMIMIMFISLYIVFK